MSLTLNPNPNPTLTLTLAQIMTLALLSFMIFTLIHPRPITLTPMKPYYSSLRQPLS